VSGLPTWQFKSMPSAIFIFLGFLEGGGEGESKRGGREGEGGRWRRRWWWCWGCCGVVWLWCAYLLMIADTTYSSLIIVDYSPTIWGHWENQHMEVDWSYSQVPFYPSIFLSYFLLSLTSLQLPLFLLSLLSFIFILSLILSPFFYT
jgi:hypothetical protein